MRWHHEKSGLSVDVDQLAFANKELAGTATFLLDDRKSSFITGQTICVDGGFTAAGIMGADGIDSVSAKQLGDARTQILVEIELHRRGGRRTRAISAG